MNACIGTTQRGQHISLHNKSDHGTDDVLLKVTIFQEENDKNMMVVSHTVSIGANSDIDRSRHETSIRAVKSTRDYA